MVDETNRAGTTGTIAGSSAGGTSSLESYIAANGPMNWRDCFALFHDVCFKMETEPGCTGEIGDLTIRSFVVKSVGKEKTSDTTRGIDIEICPIVAQKQNSEGLKLTEHTFPAEAYMSPEKCLERPLTRRSDMYSLGCVIYHCLTGAPPFMHRDTEKLKEMQTIDYALPPGRRSQRRVIPDEVDAVIDHCLEKDPAKRIKNAGLLRASLGRVLQLDDDESDEPPPHSKKFADFYEKKRKVFISVALLVAFTAGIGWLSLNVTSSDDFSKLVQKTADGKKNKFFLQLEHGPQFSAQAEYENGKMIPDPDKDPIQIKVKDEDIILFGTTKRKTVKDALEEAVKRRLIIYKADLIGQNLQGIKIPGGNLEHCFLVESNLDGADLRGSYLKESIFAGSSMKGANLSSVNSPEAVFQACNLEGANLSGAVLFDSDFSRANLKNANLSFSTLSNSNFTNADLTGANLKGATLAKAGLDTAKLTDEQKSSITIIQGPKPNAKQLEQSAKGLNLVKPRQSITDSFKEQNPFSNPVEGTGAFGPSKDEPIGMNIDLNNLPPAPPRKKRAPQPPPLQQAIPGQTPGSSIPVPPAKNESAPGVPAAPVGTPTK